MTVWIRAEPGFEEFVRMLDIWIYYIGIYILIIAGGLVMITSFLGCCAALTESKIGLLVVCNNLSICLSSHSTNLHNLEKLKLVVFILQLLNSICSFICKIISEVYRVQQSLRGD